VLELLRNIIQKLTASYTLVAILSSHRVHNFINRVIKHSFDGKLHQLILVHLVQGLPDLE
jgi:hypothetical protein